MAVKITSPGGRTRRKGGAVSLSGGDVPIVAPASDPGVHIPPPVDIAGRAFKALGNVLEEGTNLALQMIQRDEGLARDADDTTFADFGQDLVRDLQKAGTLSDSTVVENAGKQLLQEQERILNEHKGGKTSRALLENNLIKRRNSFADTLAVLNINAADVQLNQTVKRRVSSIVQDVLSDSDVLVSEDPLEAFRFYSGKIEEEMDFLELNPAQRRIVKPAAQAQVALSMVGPLIRNKQFDRAITILRSKEVGAVMAPGDQRDAIRRVITAEQKLEEAENQSNAIKHLRTARGLALPNATEEEILEDARTLAGLEESQKGRFVEFGDELLFVEDDTETVRVVRRGPTPEQKVATEIAIEQARMVARIPFMNSLIKSFGGRPIFGLPPPTAPVGEGEVEPAAPTGKGADVPAVSSSAAPTGERKETTRERAGALEADQAEAVSDQAAVLTPFGPEPENAPSEDMQDVVALTLGSRVLLAMGKTAEANSLLSHASFLMNNSPEIKRNEELDKSIGLEWAQKLGVPPDTTLRQIQGKILPSTEEVQATRQQGNIISLDMAREFQVPPNTTRGQLDAVLADRERSGGGSAVPRTFEEKTQAGSLASARGRNQAQAEVQMRFVFETDQQIADILEEIEDDPTLVGTVGALRATGRTALTLLTDLGFDSFVDAARNIASDQSDLGADEVFEFFDDPLLSALDLLSNSIGINRARLRNPIGRVPVEIIKRSIKDSDLTKFGGSEKIIDVLNRIRTDELGRRRNVLKKQFPGMFDPFLDGGGDGASEGEDAPPDIPSDIPRFRIEGGKLVPIEKGGAPGGGSSESPFSSTDNPEEIGGSAGADELQGGIEGTVPKIILAPKAQGETTVDETVAVVDQLFGSGDFLKRIAKVESNFGATKGTFRKKGDRGIWQLNQKTGFEATKDIESHPSLERAHTRIQEELGIDWNEISFEDLDKPLISALAARLFLLTIPEEIPDTLEEQATYWKKHYNTSLGKGAVRKFVKINSPSIGG